MTFSAPSLRAVGLILVVVAALAGCSDDTGQPIPASGPPTTPVPSSSGLGSGLLYLDGYSLRHHPLNGDGYEVVGRLPSVDANASPRGNVVAYVVAQEPSPQDEDFVERPELRVRDLEAADETVIGAGYAPVWDPDGARFAYLEPEEERGCEGEVCQGGATVVIADLAHGQRRTVLSSGTWALLGWMGDRVVVADQETSTTLVVDEDTSEPLDVAPSSFWGASPDGRWVASVEEDGLRFAPGPETPGRSTRVDLGGSLPGEGSWSPDSERVGAVLLAPGRGVGATKLGLVAPGRELHEVPGSAGASGPVLWSATGDSFVYTRSAGRRDLRLEAVLCDLSALAGCRPLFSWAQGVALLGLTSP